MQCPRCGQENPEGMKFCGECGSALKRRCTQCRFENPPRFKFQGLRFSLRPDLRACFESRQLLSLRGAESDEAISQSWKN
jgi:hypothetical protein